MSDAATTERTQPAAPIVQPEPKPKLPAPVALRGGGAIKAIIPQDFDQAYRIARVIAASGTAPKSYIMKDPTDLKDYLSVERIAVAIMHGLEVGLPPMQAVQGIAVINGMPTVYGDARDALVEASGLLEDRVEEHELDDQGLFLWWRCTVWRKGRKTPIEQTITRAQATRAGWLKKTGPWQESPNRMAQQRARGWAYRDAFPDVLKGLVDRDEALDMTDVTRDGSATTAPPAPRRADYVQATDVADQNGGETGNGDGERVAAVDHDPQTGEVKQAAGDQPTGTDTAANPWRPEDVGQDAITKAIVELIKGAKTVADLDAIDEANADRRKKFTQANRAAITVAMDDRREDLGGGQ